MAQSTKIKRMVEQVFAKNQRRLLNYKQIAAKLDLVSSEEKNAVSHRKKAINKMIEYMLLKDNITENKK